jgi:D-3-phosphoglycerate dehydrogenase / 2-oxoglutarate reductase
MKVLITDGLSKAGQEILKNTGIDFHIEYFEPAALIEAVKPYDGMLVRSATKVPKAVIDAGEKLKFIARAGAGVDNIDVEYAKSKNIEIMNTPGANSASVAELVLAHIFSLSRFLHQSNLTMRDGKWEKKRYKGIELDGKTLGIVGLGKIGLILAKKAIALGMTVLAYDVLEVKTELPVTFVSFPELLEKSDFISLHVPKMSKPLIGAAELAKMKKSAFLINCARGGVVDEKALVKALNNDQIAGAGIDVWAAEPTDNIELVNHPKVSCSPHIGASTAEAQDRVGIEIAGKIADFVKNIS